MPNMLAHIGIHTLVTRGLIRGADVKWIWAGCVIPDLPWIGQRAARALMPDLSPYDIRLYAIVQASLFFCLVGSAALACLSDRPRRVFAILALGAALHLVLDGLQTKWANGVHLFAPFSWELWNAGLFWPEAWPTWVLTATGLGVAVYAFWRLRGGAEDLIRPRGGRLGTLLLLGLAYLAGPLALMPGPRAADAHYIATLEAVDARPGRAIAIDRNRVVEGPALRLWTGERVALTGATPDPGTIISLQGRFVDSRTIGVTALHVHAGRARDGASYLGLALVMAWWVWFLWRLIASRRPHPPAGRG